MRCDLFLSAGTYLCGLQHPQKKKKKNPQNVMLQTVSFQPMTLLSTCYYSYHGKSSSPELVILDVRQYILILFQSVPILVLIFSLQSC